MFALTLPRPIHCRWPPLFDASETVPDGHTYSNEDWFGFQATTFPRLTLPTINDLEGKRFMNAAQRIPEESS
jgi:hypothetical protein